MTWQDYKITRLQITDTIGFHGQYIEAKQGRAQEGKARVAQETQSGKAAEAAGISSRIEEAESQEDGTRPGEAVTSTQHSAVSNQPQESHYCGGWTES